MREGGGHRGQHLRFPEEAFGSLKRIEVVEPNHAKGAIPTSIPTLEPFNTTFVKRYASITFNIFKYDKKQRKKRVFPEIGKIEFEGKESRNPLAFRYYDPEKWSTDAR